MANIFKVHRKYLSTRRETYTSLRDSRHFAQSEIMHQAINMVGHDKNPVSSAQLKKTCESKYVEHSATGPNALESFTGTV